MKLGFRYYTGFIKMRLENLNSVRPHQNKLLSYLPTIFSKNLSKPNVDLQGT
jgi:hypothetical protein